MKLIITIIFITALALSACEKEGLNGFTSLIDIQTEPVGENCNSGGLKILSGIDLNNNRILDSDEIEETKYICNGKSGNDGILSLMDILPEPSGDNCFSGGYKIISGLDINQNSSLDENEIQNTEYLCQSGLVKLQTDFFKDTVYQAKTDGFLTVRSYFLGNEHLMNSGFIIYADTSKIPSIIISETNFAVNTLTTPIQKGYYWKVSQRNGTTGLVITWLSLEN